MKAVIKGNNIYIGVMEDLVHGNHSIPTTKWEIEEDIWKPYVVFQSCANFPYIHGVMAESKDDALQQIAEIEDVDPQDLIGVEELEF